MAIFNSRASAKLITYFGYCTECFFKTCLKTDYIKQAKKRVSQKGAKSVRQALEPTITNTFSQCLLQLLIVGLVQIFL